MAKFIFDFQINTEFTDVTAAKEELTKMTGLIGEASKEGNKVNIDTADLVEAKKYAEALDKAIKETEKNGKSVSSNVKRELKTAGLETDRTAASLAKARNESNKPGGAGFQNISKAAKIATQDIRRTDTQLDRLKRNLQEGFGQTIAFAAMGAVTTAVASSVHETMKLDRVMTDISVVSGKSAEQMERYRDASFESAEALATNSEQYMRAALIFEQQGGQAADFAEALAKSTVVISNITRESMEDVSEYLTATINGFKMFEEYGSQAGQHVADVYSHLGAVSGSDTAEMAEAMQRTATIVRLSGYEFEEAAAMIATVSEATRRTPQVIGNSFKSILTSFQQLREGTEEELHDFSNKVEGAFRLTGMSDELSVFTDTGELRDARDVMIDIGEVWERMNTESRVAISEAIAGKYQAEIFQSFMENQARYNDLVGEAYAAEGIANQQQMIFMNSLDAKMGQMKGAWQQAASAMVDTDFLKGLVEDATAFLKVIGGAETSIGALSTAAAPLLGIFTQIFGDKFMSDMLEGRFQKNAAESVKNLVQEMKGTAGMTKEIQDLALADLKVSEGQTEVLSGLGENAANTYRAAHEELERLSESSKQIEENMKRAAEDVVDRLDTAGGVAGFSAEEIHAAANEQLAAQKGVIDARMSDEEEFYRKVRAEEERLQAFRTQGTTRRMGNQARYKATLEETLVSLRNISGLYAEDAVQQEAIEKSTRDINKLLLDTEGTQKLTKVEVQEQSKVLKEIVQDERNRTKASRENLEIETLQAAKLEEVEKKMASSKDRDQKTLNQNAAESVIMEKQIGLLEEGAHKANRMKKATRLLGGAMTSLGAIIPSATQALKGNITAGEFASQAIDGVSASLLMAPHPIAKVVGGLGLLINRFVDFNSAADKLIEKNEEVIRNFVAMKEGVNEGRRAVVQIKEEFEAFEGVDAAALLQGGSEEDISRYKTLSEELVNIAPELLQYYDAQGVAIVDLSQGYQSLIESRQEEVDQANAMLTGNRENFLAQFEGEMLESSRIASEGISRMEQTKKDLQSAQEMGDSRKVSKLLGDMQEYSMEIENANSKIKDLNGSINANVLRPFLETNEVVSMLSTNADEQFQKMGASIQSNMADVVSTEGFIDLVSSGNAQMAMDVMDELNKIVNSVDTSATIEELDKLDKKVEKLAVGGGYQLMLYASAGKETGMSFDQFQEGHSSAISKIVDSQVNMNRSLKGSERPIEYLREEFEKTESQANVLGTSMTALAGTAWAVSAATAPATGGISLLAGATVAATTSAIGLSSKYIYQISASKKLREREAEHAKELGNKVKALDGVRASYNEASKSVEGYEAAMSDASELQERMNELQEDINTAEAIEANSRSLEAYGTVHEEVSMANIAQVEAQRLEYEALDETLQALYAGLTDDNALYYQEWLANNEEMVMFALENYKIDATNFRTMGEYKDALSEMSVSIFKNHQKDLTAFTLEEERVKGEATYHYAQSAATQWAESVGTTIDNLAYLGNESLSVSEKVGVGIRVVLDGFMNVLIGLWNGFSNIVITSADFLQSTVDRITDSIKKTVGWIRKLLGADADAIDKENELRSKKSEEGREERKSSRKSRQDADKFEMWDTAGDYAKDKITINTAARDSAISQLTAFDGEAAETAGVTKDGNLVMPKGLSVKPRSKSIPDPIGTGPKKKEKKEKKEKLDKMKLKSKKEDVADLDLELDRYYKLNNALSVIEGRLQSISRTKDQAYGNKKISAMQREQKQYAAQEKVLSKYIAALEKERRESANKIKSSGFKIGTDGEITNLNERLAALQRAANKKTGETKEKAIERVKEVQAEAARYSEITFNLIPDKKQAIADLKATIKEIEREKIEYKVSLVVEKAELATSVRDAMKEINGEDYTRQDENAIIVGQELKESMKTVAFYEAEMSRVRRNTNLSDDARQEMLKEHQKSMLDAISAAKSSYEELSEIQQGFVSETVDMIGKVSEGYENIYDKADKVAGALKEAYGNASYQDTERLRQVQLKTLDEQLVSLSKLKTEMSFYRDSVKKGSEEWKGANDAVKDLGQQIDESLIQKLDLLKEKFTEFMEGLLAHSEKSIFGSLGLEEYEKQLERTLTKNEKMLSTFQKLTQVGGMIADVNKAIADSSDPADAEAYRKFREQELDVLLQSEKVSKHELERAQMLWEIKTKEQALEDRKNATRMAQLVRDEYGNMTYEYVPDTSGDDSGTDAAKDLADSKNALYNFDNERIEEANREILAIIADTNSQIEAVYGNENLSAAERKAALDKIYRQAQEDIGESQEDILLWSGHAMKDGIEELKHAFQENKVSFGEVGVDDDTVRSIFEAMDLGYLSVADMLNGNFDLFSSKMGIPTDEATKATEAMFALTGRESAKYSKEIIQRSDEWLKATDANLKTLANGYRKTQTEVDRTTNILRNSTKNLSKEVDIQTRSAERTTEAIRKQANQMVASTAVTDKAKTSFDRLTRSLVGTSGGGGTLGAMVNIRNDMNKKLQASLWTTERRTKYLTSASGDATDQLKKMGKQADYSYRMTRQFDSKPIRTANDNISSMSSRSKRAADNVKKLGDNAVQSRSSIAGLSVALAALPGLDSNKRHYYTITKNDGSTENVSYKNKSGRKPKGSDYVGYFDTGGYTGEWTGSSGDQEGKYLMAHEKELVLNKEDTANFLSGIEMQRQMMRSVNGGMTDVVSRLSGAGGQSKGSGDSNYTIYADFPGVSSSAEIKGAFNGLALNAASYAFKKK